MTTLTSSASAASAAPSALDQDEDADPSPPSSSSSSSSHLRPHSTPATLCWLEKNYELCEGVCIPRNVVYFNYVDFCSKNLMQPVNAASFGKVKNISGKNFSRNRKKN